MELNCEEFSAIIFCNFRRGLTQRWCIDELNSHFGDEAPSTQTKANKIKVSLSNSSLRILIR